MLKSGIIYKATNTINGKSYIGKTIQSLEERKYVHKSYSKKINGGKKVVFHSAIKKYGWESFEWEVLCECDNFDLLGIKETMKIIINNTHYIDGYGYNMTYGGEGCLGYKHSNDTKKIISNSKVGKKNPMFNKTTTGFTGHTHKNDSRKKISAKVKETWNLLSEEDKEKRLKGIKNLKLTEESRKKLSESLKGHTSSAERNKKISESLKKYNIQKREEMLNVKK